MILRPLQAEAASGNNAFLPAWGVVFRTQKQPLDECWMITQPSHAALSGELAAKLSSPKVSRPDDNILRAIALHDAGWGLPDAQAIMSSRSDRKSTRLNSSHQIISYAVFCLKKKTNSQKRHIAP